MVTDMDVVVVVVDEPAALYVEVVFFWVVLAAAAVLMHSVRIKVSKTAKTIDLFLIFTASKVQFL